MTNWREAREGELMRLARDARGRIVATACALLATVVVLAVAACSGPERPAVTPTPAAESVGFCADWFRLAGEAAKITAAQASPASPRAVLRSSVEATTQYLDTLAENAPPEVRSDFTTYARWWSSFATAMARAEYDFSKLDSDPEVRSAMRAAADPRFTQASNRISAWVQANCMQPR